jgi:hypothetical protein
LSGGVAGGDQHGVKQTAGGEYFSTKHAKIGDLGSKQLQPYFSGANWRAGEAVNASWFIQANVRRARPPGSPHTRSAVY